MNMMWQNPNVANAGNGNNPNNSMVAFINNDTDCFLTANVCKSWDILPAVPILTAINGYNNMQNKYVYENNTFHCGSFIVANNEELLSDLMEISTKLPHKFISEVNV